MIEIHESASVSKYAEIESSVRGTKITIGARVVIDSFVKIKPAGGEGDVLIDSDTVINSGCVIYTGNGLTIGRGVAVAANCTFAPVNHEFGNPDRPIREQGFRPSKGGIIVEDDVWIGAGCVLLDGTILRSGCVIGAMSLVRGEVPEGGIYGGNPLVRLGSRQ